MQLQNFECQIAKAQIGRYVAGDSLSADTVEQLEAHIAKCPDCKQNLAERRAVLQAVLSAEPEAASEMAETKPKRKLDLGDMIRSKFQSRLPKAAEDVVKPNTFTKPAMYSLALGVVLIGMSYFSRNMESLMGPRAAEKAPARSEKAPIIASAVPPVQVAKKTEPPKPQTPAPEKTAVTKQDKPKITPPAVEISSTPAPAHKEPSRRRDRSK